MVRWTLCSLVSLALFLSGCSVGLKGSGVSKTETREVGDFDSVSGVGGAKVHATQSVEAKTSGVGGVIVTGEPADRKTETSGIGSVEFK